MRLIDADAVRNPYSGTSLEWQGVLLLKLLNDAPSIDIVRCKECKHRDKMMPSCLLFKTVTEDDGYCYKGEREGE